jgi:hypothetical protein
MVKNHLQSHDAKKKHVVFASSNVKITAQEGGLPKFRIVGYTGGVMTWWWKSTPMVCDLSDAVFAKNSIAILKDHNEHDIVGHTTETKIENNQVILDGVFSGVGESAKEIVATGKNGFPWQASIGADYESLESYNEGQSVEVNGQKFEGPVDVARGLKIYETSFCVFGADENTNVQISAKKNKGKTMAKKIKAAQSFEEWAAEMGYDVATADETQLETWKAEYEEWLATQEPEPAEGADDKTEPNEGGDNEEDETKKAEANKGKVSASVQDFRNKIANDSKRISVIRKICAGQYPELEYKAIEQGWTSEQVELRILRAEKTRDRKPPMKDYSPENAVQASRTIEASALLSHGTNGKQLEKLGYDQKTINAAMEPVNRGLGLRGVIARCVQACGGHLDAGLSPTSFYDTAKNELNRYRVQASVSSFSTISLSGILSNIANKALLDGYAALPSKIQMFAKKSSHPDFKGLTSYRLGADGDFKKVPASGKIESTGLSEESYTNKVETWGRLITLTRQMIINDDLSAFTDIPRRLGMNGSRTMEREGWSTLLTSIATLFTASHGNTITDVLSVEGLNNASGKLSKTLTNDNDYSGFEGRYVIVGTSLSATADELYKSTTLYETTGNNPVYNKYEPITSPYWEGIPGKAAPANGATQWMLITDPALAPIIDIALLDGKGEPTVEDETAAFDVLGVQIRAYFDFGFAPLDWRGGVYSTGAGS